MPLTLEELERRLDHLENLMRAASLKDLPYLNATYQKLMDRIVEIDLSEPAK